jgi:hypothetical protein
MEDAHQLELKKAREEMAAAYETQLVRTARVELTRCLLNISATNENALGAQSQGRH